MCRRRLWLLATRSSMPCRCPASQASWTRQCLLTPTDSLHGGVADFIEDYGVDTIYVLGGSAAVADSVLEDMEALANEPTVTRIEGADRYATAAAIAAQLGGGAAWCGGEDAAAILVNGGDVSLAEAMMVGPIAHRMQLPVLLTAADELPSATADFIEDQKTSSTSSSWAAPTASLTTLPTLSATAGVDTVTRDCRRYAQQGLRLSIGRAGFHDGCSDDLDPVSGDTVALVHRDALPDGVAAAPVLTSTYRRRRPWSRSWWSATRCPPRSATTLPATPA